MEISDLRIFVAVAEEGSALKASRTLGMTQPGVSKHISRLEEDVGGHLFDRSARRLALNEFGKFFLKRAKKVLEEVDGLAGFKYGSASPLGHLKIGLTDSATLAITPSSLIEFRRRYPGIHVTLDVDSSTRIEEGILGGRYDLGIITAGMKTHHLLDEELLYEDCIDALVPADHDLAGKRRASLYDLARNSLIMSPNRRRTRLIIDEVFREHGFVASDIIEVYVHSAAVKFVEAGLGIALLPRMFIVNEVSTKRCAHLKISGDPIRRPLSAIRRNDKKMSEAVSFFYDDVLVKSRAMELKRRCK